MVDDAKFEDGAEKPLRLKAQDSDDLVAISAVLQDAVLPVSEMQFQQGEQRFGMLANRFRCEDVDAANASKRPVERVQAVVVFDSVVKVRFWGIDLKDKEQVISVLSMAFEAGADGAGTVVLTLAGNGAIALDVDCVEVTLADVTRPYQAPSGKVPSHPA